MRRNLICLAVLATLSLVTFPTATSAQVTNLVLNPSFEEEDDVILNDPAYDKWWTWGYDTGLAGTVKLDDTDSVDGLKSLRIDAKGDTNWYWMVINSPIAAKVGTTYTASFWAKAASPRPLAADMKATDNSVTWGGTDFQLTTEWTVYDFTAAA